MFLEFFSKTVCPCKEQKTHNTTTNTSPTKPRQDPSTKNPADYRKKRSFCSFCAFAEKNAVSLAKTDCKGGKNSHVDRAKRVETSWGNCKSKFNSFTQRPSRFRTQPVRREETPTRFLHKIPAYCLEFCAFAEKNAVSLAKTDCKGALAPKKPFLIKNRKPKPPNPALTPKKPCLTKSPEPKPRIQLALNSLIRTPASNKESMALGALWHPKKAVSQSPNSAYAEFGTQIAGFIGERSTARRKRAYYPRILPCRILGFWHRAFAQERAVPVPKRLSLKVCLLLKKQIFAAFLKARFFLL